MRQAHGDRPLGRQPRRECGEVLKLEVLDDEIIVTLPYAHYT